MMDRKAYIRNKYSKRWLSARTNIYGFMDYDKSVLALIGRTCAGANSRILEVCVGTGYPFADFLCKAGYEVHGIDLSPQLIEECKRINPDICCKVGDAEELDYPDNFFDLVYCVHSSWYIPDLNKAVMEMHRVVKSGGHVLFDVQNRNNKFISRLHKRHVFYNAHWAGRTLKTAKNFVKFFSRRGIQDWSFAIYEVPSAPENLIPTIKNLHTDEVGTCARMEDGSIRSVEDPSYLFAEHERLIITFRKTAGI